MLSFYSYETTSENVICYFLIKQTFYNIFFMFLLPILSKKYTLYRLYPNFYNYIVYLVKLLFYHFEHSVYFIFCLFFLKYLVCSSIRLYFVILKVVIVTTWYKYFLIHTLKSGCPPFLIDNGHIILALFIVNILIHI